MDKRAITFTGYSVRNIEYIKLEKKQNSKNDNFDIRTDSYVHESNDRLCKIVMKIKTVVGDKKISLELEGFFEFDKGFSEKDKKLFMKVNAAQILYPYARGIVTQLSTFDSKENIILPIINFANIND